MRIIGGKFRGRKLLVAEGATRPTLDRVRETVFNLLEHNRVLLKENGTSRLSNATVLDAFAGSGALGIEALSRGAERAVFFETDKAALKSLQANTAGMRAQVHAGSVLRCAKAPHPCDIAFFDPPFRNDLLLPAITALKDNGWINGQTRIYWEADGTETVPHALTVLLERRIGKVTVRFLIFQPDEISGLNENASRSL